MKKLIEENYQNNLRAEAQAPTRDRPVLDQNGTTGQLFRCGRYPASYNACEAIAVHNACVLLNIPSCLPDAIKICQQVRAMIFGGLLGASPLRLSRVLKKKGIGFVRFFRLKKAGEKGVYILSYWNRRAWKNGLHTVAAVYDGKEYLLYNAGSGIERMLSLKPLKHRFILGYRLTKP